MARFAARCVATGRDRTGLVKRLSVGFVILNILGGTTSPALGSPHQLVPAGSLQSESQSVRARMREARAEAELLRIRGAPTGAEENRLRQLRADWPARLAQLNRSVDQQIETERRRAHTTHQVGVAQAATRRQQIENTWAQAQTAHREYLASYVGTAAVDAQIAQQNAELQRVRLERDEVLRDLQTGMFCSECGRSRYELEHDGDSESFEQHLRRVNGRPIAKPEVVQAKRAEYAQRIAALGGRIGQSQQRRTNIQAGHQRRLTAFATAGTQFNNDIQNLDRYLAQIGARLQTDIANLPHRRAALTRAVVEAERAHHAEIEQLQDRIDEAQEAHIARIDALQDSVDRMQDYDALLVTQISFETGPRPSYDAHTTQVFERLDAMMEGRSLAEMRADEDIRREEKFLRELDMIEQALTIDPLSPDPDDNPGGRAIKQSIEAFLRAYDLDPRVRMEEEADAAYRRRVIRRHRIMLDLEPAPRACATSPDTCLID